MTDDAPTQRIIYLRAVVDAAALLPSPTSPADALAPTDVDAASGQLIVTSPVQTSARAAGPVAFAADIGDTVRLDAFQVAAKRDMAASDIAVNEQRYAAEIKNIVSTDSFGDIADGNLGEFSKYMPGVTLNRSGSDGLTMSIGGVPPGGTPIMLDGMGIASATGSNANRQVEFENIAVSSLLTSWTSVPEP